MCMRHVYYIKENHSVKNLDFCKYFKNSLKFITEKQQKQKKTLKTSHLKNLSKNWYKK